MSIVDLMHTFPSEPQGRRNPPPLSKGLCWASLHFTLLKGSNLEPCISQEWGEVPATDGQSQLASDLPLVIVTTGNKNLNY